VILGRVQRGEILEVGFDLGAIGDFKADRAEQGFDAFQRACDRMQATTRFAASGQGDVKRFFRQTGLEGQAPDCFAAGVEGCFDGFLGTIDRGTGGLALFGRQPGHSLEQFVNLAALAEESRLDLFKRIGVIGRRESGRGFLCYLVKVLHEFIIPFPNQS